MKGSLLILVCFILGCLSGCYHEAGFDVHAISVIILYVLMLLIGISLGSNREIGHFASRFSFKMLLVPVATVSGTFLFSALAGLVLSQWSVFDCMAVGSGFAYYSLSSVLITQLKEPSLGMQLATELGTIALLANIFREMTALLGAPVICKLFGRFAPISAAGVTSTDLLLPSISRYSGQEMIPIAVIHGLLINVSVPFFVSFSAGCKKDPERRAEDCLNVKRKCSTSGAGLSDLRTRVVSPCGAGRTTCIWGLEEIFPAKHEPVVVIGQIFKRVRSSCSCGDTA